MYANHTPKGKSEVQNPDFDSAPNADNGKLSMYRARPGLPYANGSASQATLDVGSGMPAGSAQYTPHHDPVNPLHRRRMPTQRGL